MKDIRQAKWKNYGPTTLKIKTDVTDYHATHPINQLLRDYNEFVRLVLKQMSRSKKPPAKADVQWALKLTRRLELHTVLWRAEQFEGSYLRDRKVAGQIREGLMSLIFRVVQHEN
jgi:hypothetical protein